MSKIKFLVMDVDGTLTNGKIYMGQNGESTKAFDIKDGCGIFLVLPKYSIVPVVITARQSQILENRCKELNITELYQGSQDKLKTLYTILEKYKESLDSVAYAGDDLPDIPCMEAVKKAGGKVLCPSDAIPEIKVLANYISGYQAGEGAIRDCINYLVKEIEYSSIHTKIESAISLILSGKYSDKTEGELLDGSKYTIQEYYTKPESECVLESHRRHIDIQYMIEGHEQFKTYTTNCLTSTGKYNTQKDVDYWQDGIVSSQSILVPGSLIVVNNNQPHKGAIQIGHSEKVIKIVCKIQI